MLTADHAEIKKRVIGSYRSWVIRLYCQIRFLIMNIRILEEIEQYLPRKGRVLDAGCGFGLFSLYFASCEKERLLYSFDLNSDRIRQARASSKRLALDEQVQFQDCDILDYEFKQQVDAIVLLDLLHHIPTSAVPGLINHFYNTISDDGVVLIKDIESKPWYKVVFTWILDKAMDPKTPVNYYSKAEMIHMLQEHGFDVKSHQLLDILPYPHVLYICRKTRRE